MLQINVKSEAVGRKCSIQYVNPLTLFRIGGQKGPPNQFFPCNFYKRRN